MIAHFPQFSTPLLPLLSAFCLTVSLPLFLRTRIWKTNKEPQKLWKNKHSVKMMPMLYLILLCLFVCQYLIREDDIMTFKCPLLSNRHDTEKDVHIQLNPLPHCPLLSALLLTPSLPKVGTSFMNASLAFI